METHDDHVVIEAKNSGVLKNRKGINIPELQLEIADLTDKDKKRFDLECGI